MSRFIEFLLKKRSKKVGLPPGTLVSLGEEKAEKVKISLFMNLQAYI